jgi:hypothetical protein
VQSSKFSSGIGEAWTISSKQGAYACGRDRGHQGRAMMGSVSRKFADEYQVAAVVRLTDRFFVELDRLQGVARAAGRGSLLTRRLDSPHSSSTASCSRGDQRLPDRRRGVRTWMMPSSARWTRSSPRSGAEQHPRGGHGPHQNADTDLVARLDG